MKILHIQINQSAYKKLLNIQERKRYPSLGDLIAYFVREENKRYFGDSLDKTNISTGTRLAGAPSPDLSNNKQTGHKTDDHVKAYKI